MNRVHAPASGLRFISHRLPKALLLTTLLLPIPAWAAGQSPGDRVQEFLESASGFYLLAPIQEQAMSPGQRMVFPVALLEGADYMVVGSCGGACSNLDLSVSDPRGVEVQADRLPDSEPILTFTAESTGSYEIHLDMVECAAEDCVTALGVLGSTDEPGAAPGEDMAGRLTLVGMEMGGLGFEEVGGDIRGVLGNDRAATIPLALQAGMEYRVVGACDVDCFDLDLAIKDPMGVEVASDFMDDDLPVLSLLADTTAEYQVEVIMVGCGVEPCAFRVAVYARQEPPDFTETTFSGELVFHEIYEGELDSGDDMLSGAYLDRYEIEVLPGQRIIADLRSEEFDTFLRVLDPMGVGDENDDYGLEQSHSHVEKLALVEGTYVIEVTSFDPYSTGAYRLQIAVVE